MSISKECLTLGPGWGWAHSQSRAARLDPSKKQRDIFPLPGVPEVRQLHRLSRRSQQRLDRKRHIYADVQHAVEGLNWMNGFSPKTEFESDPDPMQKEVLERMMHLSRIAGFKGSVPSTQPEAALRELLQGREEYMMLPPCRSVWLASTLSASPYQVLWITSPMLWILFLRRPVNF